MTPEPVSPPKTTILSASALPPQAFLSPAPRVTPAMPAVPPPAPQPKPAAPKPAPAKTNTRDRVAATLLSVVSEKTGYPVDSLDLSLSLDSDLGVDSIKRVDIIDRLHKEDVLAKEAVYFAFPFQVAPLVEFPFAWLRLCRRL